MNEDRLLAKISRLALEASPEAIEGIAADLARSGAATALVAIPQPVIKEQARQLFALWQAEFAVVSPAQLAFALRAAAHAAETERRRENISLVWTGPNAAGAALRRTDQALLEVIERAQTSLLIVSFAVYKIPKIRDALAKAAGREVKIRICVETPGAGKIAFDAIKALGERVAQNAAVYIWPAAKRLRNEYGKRGSLHAKCAIADDALLFISSANLTEYALTLNMELGVLIEGGDLPGAVAAQFTRLIEAGILTPRP